MGDFNFDNKVEDLRIQKKFSDVWKVLKSD